MTQVLIVDNDPVFRKMVDVALTKRGFTTRTASDGLEALEIIRDEPPACVVLDLILPKISGERVAACLWEDPALSAVPIIMVSGALLEGGPFPLHRNIWNLIPKGPIDRTAAEIVTAVEHVMEVRSSAVGARATSPYSGVEGMNSRKLVVELLDARRHYEQVFKTIGEGIIEVDSHARIVFFNPAAEQLLGLDWPFLLGLDLFSLVRVEDTPMLREIFGHFAAEGARLARHLTWNRAGSVLRVSVTPLFDQEEYSGAILHFRDVTVNRQRDLFQTSLIAYLNHELKNALGLMGSHAALLARGREGEFDLTRGDVLSYLQDECARLVRFVRDVSRLHQSQQNLFHMSFGDVDLAEVVRESVRRVEARIARRGIELALRLPPAVPPIKGSRDHLMQVCLNLLTNAVKVTHKGGQMTVSIETDADYARVSIKDTGAGFPPETRERVLTADPGDLKQFALRREHHELGLLIAKGIVEAHRGSLFIESRPVRGTVVGFVLPVPRPAEPSSPPPGL